MPLLEKTNDGYVLRAIGTFSLEEDVLVDDADVELLEKGDPATIKRYKRRVGEMAQETVQWGDTPFIVTESPIPQMLGTTFTEE